VSSRSHPGGPRRPNDAASHEIVELPPVIRVFIASDRSIVGLFGPLGSAKTSAGS
jgi:hypothetical protein